MFLGISLRGSLCLAAGFVLSACVNHVPASVPPQPHSELVTVFGSLPRISSIKLSPSGTYVAYLLNMGNATALVTRQMDGHDQHVVLTTDNQKYRFRWFDWVTEERLIIGVGFPHRRKGVETVETRIMAAARDGSEVKGNLVVGTRAFYSGVLSVMQFQDQVIGVVPDGSPHVLIALTRTNPHYPSVYKLNVITGDMEIVQESRPPISNWIADQSGAIRAGIGLKDSEYVAIVKDVSTGSWRELAHYDLNQVWGVMPVGFGYDPNELFVTDMHDGRRALFRLHLATGQRDLIKADSHHDVSGRVIYSRSLGRTVGLSLSTDTRRIVYWDVHMKSVQQRVDTALPNRENVIVNSAGARHLVYSSSPSSPTRVYAMDDTANRLYLIAELYPQLTSRPFAPPKKVTFTARDGEKLEGYLTLPSGPDPMHLPVILFPHGGPANRDYAHFNVWTQFFAHHGWAVLQINFRGSAGYGDDFLRAGFQRWGLEMQDDLTDGVKWLIEQGTADRERICIVGAGFGGYAALMGIIRTPDLYRCAVSFAGVTDLRMLISDWSSYLNGTARAEQRIGRWWSDRERLKQTSPAELTEKVRTPVLLAHAQDDRVVFARQSQAMAEALKNAGFADYEYLELPYGGHSLSHQETRLEFFAAMERFLVKHLGH